ncbi:hypothetical protein B5P43_35880 [Bacillus sp. SRB_336]|nr:hypothetical protein B5P43_35880 [Bacillus sp. SRB_336]
MAAAGDFLVGAAGQPWAHVAVVMACLIDGFFPPFPSETIVMGLAAAAVPQGIAAWLPLLLAAAIGAFAGDNMAYAMGRGMGASRFGWMHRPRMQRSLARMRLELDRRAVSVLFVARFIPGGRTAVNLSAGAVGYPRRRFVPISALSSLMWAGYTVGIGALAGTWLRDNPLLGAAAAVVLAGVIGLGVERLVRLAGTSGRTAEAPMRQAVDVIR